MRLKEKRLRESVAYAQWTYYRYLRGELTDNEIKAGCETKELIKNWEHILKLREEKLKKYLTKNNFNPQPR